VLHIRYTLHSRFTVGTHSVHIRYTVLADVLQSSYKLGTLCMRKLWLS
jgi:hypothetical protein